MLWSQFEMQGQVCNVIYHFIQTGLSLLKVRMIFQWNCWLYLMNSCIQIRYMKSDLLKQKYLRKRMVPTSAIVICIAALAQWVSHQFIRLPSFIPWLWRIRNQISVIVMDLRLHRIAVTLMRIHDLCNTIGNQLRQLDKSIKYYDWR